MGIRNAGSLVENGQEAHHRLIFNSLGFLKPLRTLKIGEFLRAEIVSLVAAIFELDTLRELVVTGFEDLDNTHAWPAGSALAPHDQPPAVWLLLHRLMAMHEARPSLLSSLKFLTLIKLFPSVRPSFRRKSTHVANRSTAACALLFHLMSHHPGRPCLIHISSICILSYETLRLKRFFSDA